jgi:hypothetical protein
VSAQSNRSPSSSCVCYCNPLIIFIQRLTTNKIDVQKLFDCMADQFLTQLSQAQVEKVWSDFTLGLAQRAQWIASFAATAESIEVARSHKVSTRAAATPITTETAL